MRFIFYSPVHFEKWDWRNSVEKGIGGSETSHVEMAWRLARRGHEVITYAPVPEDCPGQWQDTIWKPLETVDWSLPGVWVIYRAPDKVLEFDMGRTDQQRWLMMQDWDYTWTDEMILRFDRIITLCRCHGRDVIKKHQLIGSKMWITSNGIKPELVDVVEKERIERNPLRIMYASSPDRGLLPLLKSFKKAREYVSDLELHVFYGFDNYDKLINARKALRKTKAEIEKWMGQSGVIFHGRIGQTQLYQEWLKSGIWVYQTNFYETSCITSMEAQALGAAPIFSPIGALSENIEHGVAVAGDCNDPLTNARFASEIVRLATDHQLQERIRKPMMPWARERFSWEVFVDQWLAEARGELWPQEKFPFQIARESIELSVA